MTSAGKDRAAVDKTHYLNTDLELSSADDLSQLSASLDSSGWSVHYSDWHPDGHWFATFEIPGGHEIGPQEAIGAMLDWIEKFPPEVAALWQGCAKREFNIGYQGGIAPHAFEQSLSAELLTRVASAGCSVVITIYAGDHGGRPG